MNKITFYTSVLSLVILAFVSPALSQTMDNEAAPAFFYNLNDVPLMPGLTELTEQTLVFDKPGGRIIESMAVSDTIGREDIERFYNRTLPHLGWRKVRNGEFVRQDEALSLDVQETNGSRVIEVRVTPK